MKLLKNEMYKVFKLNKLFYFMVMAIGLLIIQGVTVLSSPSGNINGQSFPMFMLSRIMPLFIFFMALLFAEIISDEYRNGTLKLFLLRPVHRVELLNAKIAAMIISVLMLLLFVMTGSYVIGAALLGWGDQMMFNDTVFPAAQGILLTLQSYIITALPCLGFGMIIVLVSILSPTMGGTIGISLGIMFVLTALENVQELHSFSIVHQMNLYQSFAGKFQAVNVISGLVNIAMYILIFYMGSVLAIKKKEIVI
ncbi:MULTISPECIES: ABC transporter permease [Paenibacillus]|uniref:ABC transporter permease n=1 Tax=Paenibacillus borealis TaxID=160799 RepID=A0ABX3H9B7_PAEBO|nr:ABC transporter permease [Paenibacillus borealis]OMD47064.1 hypothetical protein BSK56_14640 [Paenibacillus borealis]